MSRFYVVLTTTKDKAEGKRLAKKLVSEKLVACVNVVPRVYSTYWWHGKIKRAEEAWLLMKTSQPKMKRLIARIRELHSYEVPEVLVSPSSEVRPNI